MFQLALAGGTRPGSIMIIMTLHEDLPMAGDLVEALHVEKAHPLVYHIVKIQAVHYPMYIESFTL